MAIDNQALLDSDRNRLSSPVTLTSRKTRAQTCGQTTLVAAQCFSTQWLRQKVTSTTCRNHLKLATHRTFGYGKINSIHLIFTPISLEKIKPSASIFRMSAAAIFKTTKETSCQHQDTSSSTMAPATT
jgi:hypothetical protein